MRNLFRRKSSIQGNPPKVNEEAPAPTSPPAQSLLSEEKKISGDELTNLLSEVPYQKLRLIFQKNPKLQQYITLYNFSKNLTPNYQEFRQQKLKAQIEKGLDQVLKLEELIFANYDKNKNSVIENPCPELKHLYQPQHDWSRAHRINYTTHQALGSINKIASVEINKNKNLTIYLLSLLTSLDAVPLDSIAIIDFDSLILTKEQIVKSNNQCQSLLAVISRLDVEKSRTIEKITMFKHKYDDTTPDDQTAQFHAIIRSFYDIYDKETHIFTEIPQVSIFHDFVAHPKIISSPFYQELTCSMSPESFKKFVDDLIELYNVTDEDDRIMAYQLCSFSFLPLIAGNFPFGNIEKIENIDQNNEDMSQYFDLAFEVFITIDPVCALNTISKFIDKECEVRSTEDIILNLSSHLALFTPESKDILKFIVNYSIPQFLPSKLESIRQIISVNI